MKDVEGIFFVYDITKKQTFENIKSWNMDSEDFTRKPKKIIVVRNKSDLEEEREVSTEDLKKLCDGKDITAIEISAKFGTNVKEAFESLAEELIKTFTEGRKSSGFYITTVKKNKKS